MGPQYIEAPAEPGCVATVLTFRPDGLDRADVPIQGWRYEVPRGPQRPFALAPIPVLRAPVQLRAFDYSRDGDALRTWAVRDNYGVMTAYCGKTLACSTPEEWMPRAFTWFAIWGPSQHKGIWRTLSHRLSYGLRFDDVTVPVALAPLKSLPGEKDAPSVEFGDNVIPMRRA